MPILKSITLKNFKKVFRSAREKQESSVVIGYYRVSYSPKPTQEEKRIILEAEKISEKMGIKLADFLFLGKRNEYFSFWDAGLLQTCCHD